MNNNFTDTSDFSYIDDWINKGMNTALIDLDNTLVKANITELFFQLKKTEFKRGWKWGLWLLSFALFHAPRYLILDFINREKFQRAFYKNYHAYSVELIEAEALKLFNKKKTTRIITYTDALIHYLKQRNIHIVLLSTNIEPVVRLFAREYGVDYFCLSAIPLENGCKIDLKHLHNFKLTFARQYLSNSALSVADSKHDLSILDYTDYTIVVANRERSWMRKIKGAYQLAPVKYE